MEEADRTAATAKGREPIAPTPNSSPDDRPPDALSMEESAKKAILDALARHKGNRTKASEELGISRKTIHNKLKGWGI
jgi:two-component system response regulator HydG